MYEGETVQILEIYEHMRKRPGMYLGKAVNLFTGIIIDCIALSNNNPVFVNIKIQKDNTIVFEIESELTALSVFNHFESTFSKVYHLKLMRALSAELRVSDRKQFFCYVKGKVDQRKNFSVQKKTALLTFQFKLDENLPIKLDFDYNTLQEELLKLCCVNRSLQILLKDYRTKYFNQNYFYYPQGILYIHQLAVNNILGHLALDLLFDDVTKRNKYQIAISYRSDWFPAPVITTFANDTYTSHGGTLVTGILDGLVAASKKYVKDNKLIHHKIKRGQFSNGLIITAAVRGEDLTFEGSTKECLGSVFVHKQAKKITGTLFLNYLCSDKHLAEKFLSRFDTSQVTYGMF